MAYETQQIENKTSVEKAEAAAKVKLTQAQADADALKISAEAEAEANKVLQESLTDVILQEMYIEKWDGQLPKVSNGSDMMLDVSSLVNDDSKKDTSSAGTENYANYENNVNE